MKKVLIISSILLTVLALTSLTQTAYASVGCERQYGGGEICVKTGNIQVDKEVLNPADGKFADNLSIASEKFTPSQEITFKIKVKNVGDAEFAKVEVTDKNRMPKIIDATKSINANINKPVIMSVKSADEDGDDLTYTWDFGIFQKYKATASHQRTFTSRGAKAVKVTVSDGIDEVEQVINVNVV